MRFLAKYILCLTILISASAANSQTPSASCPLVAKTASIAGGVMSYLQGGKGEAVLLLHGLFAQKEQWTEVGCALANQGFDVIIPDLPGYGASTGYLISDYPLESQVRILQQLMGSKQLAKFHIAGSSMGGAIAAMYANQYPKQIKSLAFIGAPMGIVSWSPQVKEAIFQGINPFIPINAKQFDLEMSLLFYRPPQVDQAIKSQLLKEYQDNNRHYQQVWDIVNFYDQVLEGAPVSSPRVLILWGRQDGIFNVAGFAPLKKRYTNSQTSIFPDAAHLLMLEDPQKVIAIYGQFLKR
jgi:abhydrolase domain-containing protein 6